MALGGLLLALAACEGATGSGTVEADFTVTDCPPGTPRPALEGYRFDAGWLATERFAGILIIHILEYAVRIEETDGLAIRLDIQRLLEDGLLVRDLGREQIVRADSDRPLEVPLALESPLGNAALSLFQTCPNFPTAYALDGVLSLSHLTLASDPEATGERERLGGTVTATLTRSGAAAPIGTLRARFDFAPPRRPLVSFR